MKFTKKGIEFNLKFDKNLNETEIIVQVQDKETTAYVSRLKNQVIFLEGGVEIDLNNQKVMLGGVSLSKEKIEELETWHQEEKFNYLDNADIQIKTKKFEGMVDVFSHVTVNGESKYHSTLKEYFQVGKLKQLQNMDLTQRVEKEEKIQETEDCSQYIKEAKAKEKNVIISKWLDSCNDPNEECSTDVIRKIATPDGTIKFERFHTY